MRRALLALSATSLVACASTSSRSDSPSLRARLPSLRVLGVLTPVLEAGTPLDEPEAREAWKREAEEVVVAALGTGLQKRGITVLRLEPKPATKDGLARLARRFDEIAYEVERRADEDRRPPKENSFGDLSSLSAACGVDGFVVASGTATSPRGPPRPSTLAGTSRSSSKDIAEAAAGSGLSGDESVGLAWIAAGIVDASGELLWFATEGTPGEEDPDPAPDVARELVEGLPGRAR